MKEEIINKMKSCDQIAGVQSIWEHGRSVNKELKDIIKFLKGESNLNKSKIPPWLENYQDQILKNLYSQKILDYYTIFHDCGKPYCYKKDEYG